MLGVAILVIVMSVMNGFKTELTKKILGLNPHVVIQPNGFKIENKFLENLKAKYQKIKIAQTYMGEGIILNENNAKGIIIKGINLNDGVNLEFLRKNIAHGSLSNLIKIAFLLVLS